MTSSHDASTGALREIVIADSALTTQAMAVLSTNCAACHSSNSPGFGGFSSSDDAQKMYEDGLIAPGDPQNSALYLWSSNGSMPPGAPIGSADYNIIADWIRTEITYK